SAMASVTPAGIRQIRTAVPLETTAWSPPPRWRAGRATSSQNASEPPINTNKCPITLVSAPLFALARRHWRHWQAELDGRGHRPNPLPPQLLLPTAPNRTVHRERYR